MTGGARFIAACAAALLSGCHGGQAAEPFAEIAQSSGLQFVHVAGAEGHYYLPEIMGAGVALLDYDGDGDLDVVLLQGGALGPEAAAGVGQRLYRNELGSGDALHFTEVTQLAGLDGTGYAMGAATADLDGDGDPELYITQLEHNRLYRNDGGHFTDITDTAGVGDAGWSTSASFCDYDRDGDLDLYVAHYVNFALQSNQRCLGTTGRTDYCSPEAYAPESDHLFRNDGDLRFSDVSAEAGIATHAAAGLGVVCADFDGDGWPDYYVANDRSADYYWHNRGDGRFEEQGAVRGAAYDGAGSAEASMGIAVGDYDGDGDADLFVTTYDPETNTLRENDGRGYFLDVTDRRALGYPSLSYTGWGTAWLDYDGDGLLDLFIVDGGVVAVEAQRARSPRPYEERNQLYRQQADGHFRLVPATGALGLIENSRGAAFGDLDQDGAIDIVINDNDGPARLLRNARRGPHWLGLALRGAGANTTAIGARVSVQRQGAPALVAWVHTDGSYLSASDPRLSFALGGATVAQSVAVEWPDGRREQWRELGLDRYHRLSEGEGTAPAP